jgi:hypothetical protein
MDDHPAGVDDPPERRLSELGDDLGRPDGDVTRRGSSAEEGGTMLVDGPARRCHRDGAGRVEGRG